MQQASEIRKTVNSIRPPDYSFMLINSACQAVSTTMERLTGQVDPQVLETIQTELHQALDETFRRVEKGVIRKTSVKTYDFERCLSNLVLIVGRDLIKATKGVTDEVYDSHISYNNEINPKKVMSKLRKGYTKALTQIEKQLVARLKEISKSESVDHLFERSLLENVRGYLNKLKQSLATDQNLYQSADPVGKALQDARQMYQRQGNAGNAAIAAQTFIETHYTEPLKQVVEDSMIQQLSDFQNKNQKPMSYMEQKTKLDNFFDPLFTKAYALDEKDPSRDIIIALLKEAKLRASLVFDTQFRPTQPELSHVKADSRRSSIRLESMGSEPASRRGSVRMGSRGTETPEAGGSAKSSKGVIPDAFKIDPKILADLKAKREAEQQAEAKSTNAPAKNSNN